jgi:hypothetical protein
MRARVARVRIAPLIVAALFGNLPLARAEVPRCSQARADLSYRAQDLPDAHGDTGWFPSGSPAQLRLTGQLVGETTVAMSLQPTACWSGAMTISAPGIARSGLLDSQYGADFTVQGQIHWSVLGYSIDWQGNIPLPSWVPNNLLIAGTTAFDPVALPDSRSPVVSVTSNQTSPITLLSTDVLSSIIDIVGLSGGVRITAQGQMTTSYKTESIAIGGATLTSATGQAAVATPSGGFTSSLGATISAKGTVSYAPSIVLSARLYASAFGFSIVNWDLADVTIPLPAFDRGVQLDAQPLSIPLPRLAPPPTSLGFETGATQTLTLHDAGDMALSIEVMSAPAGVTAAPITIAPGQDGALQVTAADPSALDGAELVLATNDPSQPTVSVKLEASGSGPASDPVEHHGGCSTGGGSGGAASFALVAVALAACARRRRAIAS